MTELERCLEKNQWLELSDIKYVVDGWKNSKAPLATEARLIKKEEIEIEIREYDPCGGCGAVVAGECAKYDWLYNSNYWYWTISQYGDSSRVWNVCGGNLYGIFLSDGYMVRSVLELLKSADITTVS